MKISGLIATLILSLSLTLAFSGCRKEGAAEKTGETLDNAGDAVKDAVTPDGPAEKAGKKVDKALD